MVRCAVEGVGFLKMIQKFGQAARILEKEPAHHRLKARGLPIEGGLLGARAPSCPVAPPPHHLQLLRPEMGSELGEGLGLGPSLHPGHHPVVQVGRAAWGLTALQTLVKFPHRISQPGQLEDLEFGLGSQGG
jgi:hypothetical protein